MNCSETSILLTRQILVVKIVKDSTEALSDGDEGQVLFYLNNRQTDYS